MIRESHFQLVVGGQGRIQTGGGHNFHHGKTLIVEKDLIPHGFSLITLKGILDFDF